MSEKKYIKFFENYKSKEIFKFPVITYDVDIKTQYEGTVYLTVCAGENCYEDIEFNKPTIVPIENKYFYSFLCDYHIRDRIILGTCISCERKNINSNLMGFCNDCSGDELLSLVTFRQMPENTRKLAYILYDILSIYLYSEKKINSNGKEVLFVLFRYILEHFDIFC